MVIDSGTLRIMKLVVHSIPKHKKGDFSVQPEYSENESDLADGMKVFFKAKINQSLDSSKQIRVIFDTEQESPVSLYVNSIIETKGNTLVEQSRLITKYMYEIQHGQNASGIVVVIYGEINDKSTCIIMKLEKDEGAQLKLDPITKSFNIDSVKDLMLTAKTKIYKVGLFINKTELKVDFNGSIADLQIDVKTKKEITTWFIEKFLGCKPIEDARVITKKFYSLTTTFIQTIEDTLTQAKYIQDLNSYMQKNSSTLSAQEFADDYLTSDDKKSYILYLEDKKFKLSSFSKDNILVETKIKKITMTFENNITLIGNKGTLDNQVKFEKQPDGITKVEMFSKLKSVA